MMRIMNRKKTKTADSVGRRQSQGAVINAVKFETAMSGRQSRQFINDVTSIIKERLLDGFNVKINSIGTLVLLPIDRLVSRKPHRANTDLIFIPRSSFLRSFDNACSKQSVPREKTIKVIDVVKKRMPHIAGADEDLVDHPINRLIALWRQDLGLSTQITLPTLGAITSRHGAGSALKKKWAEKEGRGDEPSPFYVDFAIDPTLKSELLDKEKRNRIAKAASASTADDSAGIFEAIATGPSDRREVDLIPPPPISGGGEI